MNSLISQLKRFAFRHPALERVARSALDLRYKMARRHLGGVGLEIGALDRPLRLPQTARAFYLDRLLPAELYHHYPELDHRHFYVSVVGDGETMACIRDESLDFLVANHVIEHTQDPIGTFKTFFKKLRPKGKIFMAVPDMRRTFDHSRIETTWVHLSTDHEQGTETSRREHYQEWAEWVDGLRGSDAEQRATILMEQDYSIHFHCWTLTGFSSFLERLAARLPLRVLETRSWRNENIFIIERTNQP
jgi:predicted SAM-dependent methyltransferase